MGMSLTHEELERRAPLVDVGRQRRSEGRHESHVLAGEDESHVSAEAEERVVLLSLLRRRDLRKKTIAIAIAITITIIACGGPSTEKEGGSGQGGVSFDVSITAVELAVMSGRGRKAILVYVCLDTNLLRRERQLCRQNEERGSIWMGSQVCPRSNNELVLDA